MRYRVWQTEIGNYGSFFILLCPPKNLKNQNFGKMKNVAGDIIISHMCTKNQNHIRYGFSDTEWKKQISLSFWVSFCPFTPLTIQKIKILKKRKKPSGDVIILHMCAKNHNHIMYASWDMECERHKFLSFWTILGVLFQKLKFGKNVTKPWRHYPFTHAYHKP